MEIHFTYYITAWATACVIALCLTVRGRESIELFRYGYWRLLFQRWKVLSFCVATTALTVVAPYTGDPTWDYVDAPFMATLTFLSAPWAIATFFRVVQGRTKFFKGYIALCLCMFSASWSYDIYIVFRDGHYSETWLPNIFASSVLYVVAGLLWNLEWSETTGAHFGFTARDWPNNAPTVRCVKILWMTVPFILLVVVLFAQFFII